MALIETDNLVTIRQAAHELGIKYNALDQAIRRHSIEAERRCPDKVYIRRTDYPEIKEKIKSFVK